MSCKGEEVAQAQDAIAAKLIHDAAELARWKGLTLLPSKGLRRTWLPLGDASVWAEYEVLDDQCIVYRVLINGQLVSAEDWLSSKVVADWEEELWNSHKQELEAA